MDLRTLQTELKKLYLYSGNIDGLDGKQTQIAVSLLLHREIPRSPYPKWPVARQQLAAKQIIARLAGIDVGEIDGLMGPQTQVAFDEYAGKGPNRGVIEQKNAVGFDPLPPLVPTIQNNWPLQKDVTKFYGAVGKNQAKIKLPYPMKLAWDKKQIIQTMTLHEKVADSAKRVMYRVADHYQTSEIASLGLDLFGGSLNVRKMRGGSAYSMHSWGIAIDFDPERNQLAWGRDKARLAKKDAAMFWNLWEEEGWVSLGRSKNYDWMHVQAARL